MKHNLILLAIKNIRGRKKKMTIGVLLLVVSMLVIMICHIGINGYKNYIQKTLVDIPSTKCMRVATEKIEECERQMRELFAGDDRITKIVTCYEAGSLEITSKEFLNEFTDSEPILNVHSYQSMIQEYIMTDIEELGEYDAVLPKYIFDTQEDEKTESGFLPYVDTEKYVGKTLNVKVNDKKYTINIVGVYDSLKTTDTTTIYMNYDTLKKMYHMEEKDENMIIYDEFCYLWIENYADRDEVMYEVKEYYQQQGELFLCSFFSSMWDGYMEYLDFLKQMGTLIGIIGWGWAFVSIVLVTIQDVQQRMPEFAMMKAIGYEEKNIKFMLGMEMGTISVFSLCVCLLTGGIGCVLANGYIRKYMNLFWGFVTLKMDMYIILLVTILGITASFIAWVLAGRYIKNMDEIKELRSRK